MREKVSFAVLIDPDKTRPEELLSMAQNGGFAQVDLILVGGSLVSAGATKKLITEIKVFTDKPIILFPGNGLQIANNADAILLLSLISGRNPDLLIGKQVEASISLREAGLEIMPTGYMLIDGGKPTSVSYMSQTIPLPANKPSLALATALAGQQLGLQQIYLDAGSGAENRVPDAIIKTLYEELDIPIWVGGGIRRPEEAYAAAMAGASVVVVGSAIEEGALAQEFAQAIAEVNHKIVKS